MAHQPVLSPPVARATGRFDVRKEAKGRELVWHFLRRVPPQRRRLGQVVRLQRSETLLLERRSGVLTRGVHYQLQVLKSFAQPFVKLQPLPEHSQNLVPELTQLEKPLRKWRPEAWKFWVRFNHQEKQRLLLARR